MGVYLPKMGFAAVVRFPAPRQPDKEYPGFTFKGRSRCNTGAAAGKKFTVDNISRNRCKRLVSAEELFRLSLLLLRNTVYAAYFAQRFLRSNSARHMLRNAYMEYPCRKATCTAGLDGLAKLTVNTFEIPGEATMHATDLMIICLIVACLSALCTILELLPIVNPPPLQCLWADICFAFDYSWWTGQCTIYKVSGTPDANGNGDTDCYERVIDSCKAEAYVAIIWLLVAC